MLVNPVKRVRKRDGRVVNFDQSRVTLAISKAIKATGEEDVELAEKLVLEVVNRLSKSSLKIPGVEDVQDVVELVLIDHGHPKTARAYILYRKKRQELRETRSALGIDDDLKLSFEALNTLGNLNILKQKEKGLESPREMFERVAKALARVDKKEKNHGDCEKIFVEAMTKLKIIPSVAILKNAGVSNQLCESFVFPLEDSTDSLFDTLKQASLIHRHQDRWFGLGINFSHIRAKGSNVAQTQKASGPVEFLRLFDRALYLMNPKGNNLAFLSVHHPDIIDFLTGKDSYRLRSFGTAVLLSKDFMRAFQQDKSYKLTDPDTKEVVSKLRARSVLDMIAAISWRTGDPTVVFLDNLNKNNPSEQDFEALMHTGEQALLNNEGAFTASINLANHIKENDFDWDELKLSVRVGVDLLDNAVDLAVYPSSKSKDTMKASRRIGLGVMGWADALIQLQIPYNSEEALKLAEKVMKFVNSEAKDASKALSKNEVVRNVARTTINSSGINAVIAGCSPGVEPYFAISYLKKTPTSETLEVIPIFEQIAHRENFYSPDLMKEIAQAGSVRGVKGLPLKWKKLFVTMYDLSSQEHLDVQAVFQKYTDNGVSKTINVPQAATIDEVKEVFLKAHELGCKSVHVYREGSASQLINSRVKGKKRKR